MNTKLLSIIIPSYNMEKYLDKCIQSCLVDDNGLRNQLDVIVVNDGSRDCTSEIAHSWAQKYPNIVRVIDKENGNYGSCINVALPIATGEFIKILDADDSFDRELFQGFLSVLASAPVEVDVAIFDYVFVNEKGSILSTMRYNFPEDRVFSVEEMVQMTPCMVYMNVIAYRRQILHDLEYRQLTGISYTDLEWNFIPMSKVRKCIYYPKPVHRYLCGREGQTTDPEIYRKNVWMLGKVVYSLVSWGERLKINYKTPLGRYLFSIIDSTMHQVYRTLLTRMPSSDIGWLQELDIALKKNFLKWYDIVGAYSVGRMKFQYVIEWRKRKTNRTLKFGLYNWYNRGVMCVVSSFRVFGKVRKCFPEGMLHRK